MFRFFFIWFRRLASLCLVFEHSWAWWFGQRIMIGKSLFLHECYIYIVIRHLFTFFASSMMEMSLVYCEPEILQELWCNKHNRKEIERCLHTSSFPSGGWQVVSCKNTFAYIGCTFHLGDCDPDTHKVSLLSCFISGSETKEKREMQWRDMWQSKSVMQDSLSVNSRKKRLKYQP